MQEQRETKESLDSGKEDACVFLTFKSQTLKAKPTEVKTHKNYSTEWKKRKKINTSKLALTDAVTFLLWSILLMDLL